MPKVETIDRVGIDWLQGSFPFGKLSKIKDILRHFFGDFMPRDRGVYGYTSCETTAQLCFLAWTEGRGEACLSIPGACVSQLDAFGQMALLATLRAEGLRVTRLDVAFDDFTKSFTPGQFSRAFGRGQCCGFRIVEDHQRRKATGGVIEDAGQTCAFGRRGKLGGGRQVVVYDKELESKGLIKSVRIEARFYKELANEVAMWVLGSKDAPEEFEQALRDLVGGAIDFRIRTGTGERHVDRLRRPAWWSRILERLGEAHVSIVRETAKLEQSARHLQQAYAPTMATIAEALEMLGGDFYEWMAQTLDSGVERQGQRHEQLLRQYLLDIGRPVSEVDELMAGRTARREMAVVPF